VKKFDKGILVILTKDIESSNEECVIKIVKYSSVWF